MKLATPPRSRSITRRLAASLLVLAVLAGGGFLIVREVPVLRARREARAAIASGRYAEAEAPLRRWIAARPKDGEPHFLLARAALEQERPQEALHEIARATDRGYDRQPLDRLLAIIKARAGRFEEAEPALREAFRGRPEPDVDEALARVLIETFRFAEAVPVLDQWALDAPEDPRPYLWRIAIFRPAGSAPPVLIKFYRAALARDPTLDETRLGLAEELVKDHRYDEAAREYRAYNERNPEKPGGYVGLGHIALEQGNAEAARPWFEKALAIDPDDPVVLKEVASIEMSRGDFVRALEQLDRSARLAPHDPEVHYRRSIALRQLGRDDEAAEAQAQHARLKAGDDRMADLRRSMLRDPDNLALQVEAAAWLLDRDQADEGLRWANLVLRRQPGHPEMRRVLAAYYDRTNNPGLANFYRLGTDGR
jgi:predicted Zn-dependent protease